MASRQRNPRGQTARLRADIIEAASRLLANPAAPPLTLRAVAREAGVAATSVYLHFADIESLILAVAERGFGELVRLQDEARDENSDPAQQVRAGCLAYCEFGLAHPGHYQVMFANPLPLPADTPPDGFPGMVHARTGRCWQQQSRLPHGTSRTPVSTTQPQSAQLTSTMPIVTRGHCATATPSPGPGPASAACPRASPAPGRSGSRGPPPPGPG